MRQSITVLVLVGSLAVPIGSTTLALADNSSRPGGSITNPVPQMPQNSNSGDQGWGNCGHNSSIGNPHTGDNGVGGGNGGVQKADCIQLQSPAI